MLAESIRDNVLCDELQLGTRLNQCTQQGKAEQFRLLLSMLSPNVCDQAQFDMRKAEPALQAQHLRDQFQLPPEAELLAQTKDFPQQAQLSHAANQGDLADIRLAIALQNAPLHAVDEIAGLKSEVMDNVDLLTRLKQQTMRPQQAVDSEVKGSDMYHVLTDFDYSKPLKLSTPSLN